MSQEIQQTFKEVEIITNRLDQQQQGNKEYEGVPEIKIQSIVHNGPPQNNMIVGEQEDEKPKSQNLQTPQRQFLPRESANIDQELDIFKQDEQKSNYPGLQKIIDNNYFQTFITLITVYALLGDDIRVMGFDKSADQGFDIITIVCLVFFSFEITVGVVAQHGYFNSFFFWLDVISTLSLILDIQMFSNQVFYGDTGTSVAQTATLARAGRASRVGTKAGRVVRLVRLIRIVKLYKATADENQNSFLNKFKEKQLKKRIHPQRKSIMVSKNLQSSSGQNPDILNASHMSKASQSQNQNNSQDPRLSARQSTIDPTHFAAINKAKQKDSEDELKESRVSKKLSDLTTKRVIIIVLLLLFIMPLFSADYFFEAPTSINYAVQYTPFSFIETYEDKSTLQILRNDEQESASYDLNLANFRYVRGEMDPEIALLEAKSQLQENTLPISGILNKRYSQIFTAGLSFGRTLFVCIVLTMGALMFSKDANDIALRPIERMIEKVTKIARNPILAKELQLIKGEDSKMETAIIENAIIKIGSLLALGFGDAGSEIIGSNMSKGGDVDPMIPGKKKFAIYGFCDIRNFTDATEQLQEEVMLFVNNIGDVVHSMVDRFGGAANKNIGDAFLLVWKVPDDKYHINPDNTVSYKDTVYISTVADFSLVSFMKVQAKLNRERKILEYRKNEKLLARMPNYKVKMGFGLHSGWGIEGAIGSEFKIDASYLSPNVNMASRLEAGTKQFGVPLLISSDLQALFTPQMQRFCRYIDRVTVKGSITPTGLFTIDMDVDLLTPSKDPAEYEKDFPNKKDRQEYEKLKKLNMMSFLLEPEENEWDAEDFMQANKDLRLMMETWDENFQNIFADGFEFYLKGSWGDAKSKFLEVQKIQAEDGPTQNLMNIMGETGFKAPSDWPGYRVLTDK